MTFITTEVSHSIKYLEAYKFCLPMARRVQKFAIDHRKAIAEFLDLKTTPNVHILIRPIRMATSGVCHFNNEIRRGRISIDPRYEGDEPLLALTHEMVHLKQYDSDRLVDRYNSETEQWDVYWEGKLYTPERKSHEGYRACPWEIEAYAQQSEILEKIRRS